MDQAVTIEDALGLYDAVNQKVHNPVVLVGHSLGTAVAAQVAARLQAEGNAPACMLLLSPFTSMTEEVLSYTYYLAAPWMYILHDGWDTITAMKGVTSPLVVMSASDDLIVPSWMHEQVYKKAGCGVHGTHVTCDPDQKKLLLRTDVGHNDVYTQIETHSQDLSSFLQKWATAY